METHQETQAETAGAVHPDELLCFAIYSASLAFTRAYKPLLRDLGLTYPQYLVMIALWQRDGRTVADVGRDLFLESNTLTPLFKRLEAMGCIVRRRDDRDERRVRLWLTEKGRGMREKADGLRGCVAALAGMAEDEMDDLRDRVLAFRNRLVAG